MPAEGYEELIILNRKLDELLIKYSNLKAELAEIKTGNEALISELEKRDARIKDLEIKYERVKLTGALLGGNGNEAEAKKKITELVREIDKCVTLLNK